MNDFQPLQTNHSIGASILLAGSLLVPAQSAVESRVYGVEPAQGQQTLESKALALPGAYCISCPGPDKLKGDTDDLQTLRFPRVCRVSKDVTDQI